MVCSVVVRSSWCVCVCVERAVMWVCADAVMECLCSGVTVCLQVGQCASVVILCVVVSCWFLRVSSSVIFRVSARRVFSCWESCEVSASDFIVSALRSGIAGSSCVAVRCS